MLAIALTVTGCATPSESGGAQTVSQSDDVASDTATDSSAQSDDISLDEEEPDPLEPMNRAIFDFNDAADRFVIRPLAVAYRDVVPDPAQRGVHNALANLRSPIVFANDVLQGNPPHAGITFTRFLINSTVGVLGLFDIATDWGLPQHDEDFGLTFASWGVDQGPYLVLPILGPSNPRDASGELVEFFTDPFSIVASDNHADYLNYIRYGLTALDQRSRVIDELDNIRSTSLDYYAAIRSLYQQRRQQQIRTNALPSVPGPSGSSSPGAAAAPSGAPPPPQ
jgi:phospholipid-binding lipoprotein MlaA